MKKIYIIIGFISVLIFSLSLFFYFKVNFFNREYDISNKSSETMQKEYTTEYDLNKKLDNQNNYIKNNKYFGYQIDNSKNACNLKSTNNIDLKKLIEYDDWLAMYDNDEWKKSGSFDISINKNELLRNNNGFVYSILKLKKQNGYIFTVYDKGFAVAEIHIIKIPSKYLLVKKLKKGVSVKKIAEIDKTILEAYSNTSRHRFNDGTMVYIETNFNDNGEKDIITDWFYKKDPIGLINNILKKDYDLIK